MVSKVSVFCSMFFPVLLLSFWGACIGQELSSCGFTSIFNFGDSLSDTGNSVKLYKQPMGYNWPYGVTIHKSTGRCSDGLLAIDYIATSAGLPYLPPYLGPNVSDFHQGVNFAVGGATALPPEMINITVPGNGSFSRQLQWMDKFCRTNAYDCKKKLNSSLVIVGEIGTNDYLFSFIKGKTIEEVKTLGLVSKVIEAIREGVKTVISYGARQILVPGTIQFGCMPMSLSLFWNKSISPDKYDCLEEYNDFSAYHNDQLQRVLEELRKEYPDTIIVYGDYYHAMQDILDNLGKLGFSAESMLKACCGIGGKYNFDLRNFCGQPSTMPPCSHPQEYISWDGIHFTQSTYQNLAEWVIRDTLPQFQCGT